MRQPSLTSRRNRRNLALLAAAMAFASHSAPAAPTPTTADTAASLEIKLLAALRQIGFHVHAGSGALNGSAFPINVASGAVHGDEFVTRLRANLADVARVDQEPAVSGPMLIITPKVDSPWQRLKDLIAPPRDGLDRTYSLTLLKMTGDQQLAIISALGPLAKIYGEPDKPVQVSGDLLRPVKNELQGYSDVEYKFDRMRVHSYTGRLSRPLAIARQTLEQAFTAQGLTRMPTEIAEGSLQPDGEGPYPWTDGFFVKDDHAVKITLRPDGGDGTRIEVNESEGRLP